MRTILLTTIVAAAVAGGTAQAGELVPRIHVKHMTVTIDVHALHVTDWRDWTEPTQSAEPSWTHADGTQVLGWAYHRPIKAKVTLLSSSAPGLTPLIIVPQSAGMAKLTARRSVHWIEHAEYLCDSEGGCGGSATTVREWTPKFSCPSRRLEAGMHLGVLVQPDNTSLLTVGFDQTPGNLWAHCPPEGGERSLGTLRTALPQAVILNHGIASFKALKVGQALTLKGAHDRGYDGATRLYKCPTTLTGFGFKECSATEVIVRVKRVR